MPLIFGPAIVEGKVYRSRRRNDDDDEKQALAELQALLNIKNRRPCDCEAQVHDLLENCLNCGRLTCESEGPGKCFSCSNLVLTQEQRERLTKHIDISQSYSAPKANKDSQSTSSKSQIKIIDNQFDQFAIDNQRHLREDEKAKLKESLSDLQSKRYQRKLVLDVDLDNMQAGSSSQPLIEDYSVEMRKLQITGQEGGSSSEHPTLMEVLERTKDKQKAVEMEKPKASKNDDNNKREKNR